MQQNKQGNIFAEYKNMITQKIHVTGQIPAGIEVEMIFNEILEAVHTWFNNTKNNYASDIKIEIIQDNDTLFHVFFETENHISELIVNKPYFAPYRYVSFMVMDLKQDPADKPVFCYYDDNSCTVQDILNKLDIGLETAVHQEPASRF